MPPKQSHRGKSWKVFVLTLNIYKSVNFKKVKKKKSDSTCSNSTKYSVFQPCRVCSSSIHPWQSLPTSQGSLWFWDTWEALAAGCCCWLSLMFTTLNDSSRKTNTLLNKHFQLSWLQPPCIQYWRGDLYCSLLSVFSKKLNKIFFGHVIILFKYFCFFT